MGQATAAAVAALLLALVLPVSAARLIGAPAPAPRPAPSEQAAGPGPAVLPAAPGPAPVGVPQASRAGVGAGSSSSVGGTTSSLWGVNGELWDPRGLDGRWLPDFSFAGYKQGAAPLPSPPVTRSVLDFRGPGMSDTAMLLAALQWANTQPLTQDHVVLFLPAGEYMVEALFAIKRSRVVLRGAGAGATVLSIPKSITSIQGPNPNYAKTGGYVNDWAFVMVQGEDKQGMQVATVTAPAQRGDTVVTLDNPSALRVGQIFDTWWRDVGGRFNNYMFDDLWEAPDKYAGEDRVMFSTRVLAINGQQVTLERRLPYDIRPDMNVVTFHERNKGAVQDSGVEGLTFKFAWEPYAGHHLEKGWNALYFEGVYDCWARDIHTINADNTITMSGATAVTVSGVKIEANQTRANFIPNAFDEPANKDGHWGVQHARSFDVLAERIDVRCMLMHDVGTGSGGKWGVYMNSVMVDGNLDLHRALSGPTLYTNISAGRGSDTLRSGGPPASGPNAAAGTTWWHITTDVPIDPPRSDQPAGDCSFGPSINLVGVNIIPEKAATMCKTWHFERGVNTPANLYTAQLQRRRAAEAAVGAAGAPSVST